MPSVKVATIDDLPVGAKKSFRASKKARVLIVNVDGKLYGIEPYCSHFNNPLFTGKLQGNILWCDNHYASFDVTTGKVNSLPKQLLGVKHIRDLKTYPVRVEGKDVIVEVPE
jgi:3-phenylpropionate/trans-cinnamate dioxygenase ferredoxin subunit